MRPPTEVEARRKAFIRKWRLKHRAVADSLEEAGERLFTFTRLPASQWKSVRTTNAIERLHEEFKRKVISLYDLSVPTFLQTVNALAGALDRADEHCAKTGHDPDDFVEVRLIDDMAPFHFQIEAAWHHAVWGLEAARTGAFTPPALVGPVPFGDLQGMMEKAKRALEAFEPDEVNGWAGKHLDLPIGPRKLAFTSETLILSFSMPNFYFHVVTAYDILRMRGVPIGKRDYEGQLRTRSY